MCCVGQKDTEERNKDTKHAYSSERDIRGGHWQQTDLENVHSKSMGNNQCVV